MERQAEAIAACRDAQGRITPTAVWKAAQDPENVLHPKFQWDVDKAAERDWERTASELIRQVRLIVEYEERKIAVPFYVSDPRNDTSAYVATSRVARSAVLSERVLRDELDRITAAIHRAMNLAAAFGLVSSFERMLEQATEIETRLGDHDDDEARV
jgi:hypothetical protein